MSEPQPNDTRRNYKVLKDWNVTDTILSYYGDHKVGDTVFVHEDVANPLVEEGILELIPEADGSEPAPTGASAEEVPQGIRSNDQVDDGANAPAHEDTPQ